jgi:uncharacterized protein YjbI with pentapeptide repeats
MFMANAEYLALLQQGSAIWNGWRNSVSLSEFWKPDLSGANLSGTNLREAILDNADLSYANL